MTETNTQIQKKKMNTYVKYLGITALCAVIGGICGMSSGALLNSGLGNGAQGLSDAIRRNLLPILSVLAVIAVASLEYTLFRVKKAGNGISEAEDEECDKLEYEIEKIGGVGVALSNAFTAVFLLILSTGFSMEYLNSMERAEGWRYLAAVGVFGAACLHYGIWQVRYVKTVQKIYPYKKGDPASFKFQEQWLESCDEAEKEVIYQSSYKTYLIMMKIIPLLLAISMFCHFIWNTGIMAILMVSIMWIVTSVTYCRSCIIKKGQKINKE